MLQPILASDFYIAGFLIFLLPVMAVVTLLGVISLWRRWRIIAALSGLAWLLLAPKLLLDARDRQDVFDSRLISAAGVFSFFAGVAFIALSWRQKPKHNNGPG